MKLEKRDIWYYVLIAVFGMLFSLAYFLGVDAHSGYYGFVCKILYPETFLGDAQHVLHPASISLYTLLVKLFGPLWLDDRFNIVIYGILYIITAAAVHKILGLFGVKNNLTKLAIIAVLTVNHQFLENVTQLLDPHSYRPSTYAHPIGMWLAYLILKGSSAYAICGVSLILLLTSVKNGWHPAFVSGIFVLREHIKMKWKWIVGILVGGLIVFLIGNLIWNFMNGTIEKNSLLFDYLLSDMDGSEAHPFMDGSGIFVYLFLFILAMYAQTNNKFVTVRIHTILIISVILYFLGGIYYSFTPVSLKVPLFIAFAVNRSVWWSLLITFIFLGSYFGRMYEGSTGKKKILYGLFFIALYLFPLFDYVTFRNYFAPPHIIIPKLRLFALGIIGMGIVFIFVLYKLAWDKRRFINLNTVLYVPVIVATILSLGLMVTWRSHFLKLLLHHGIMGTAKSVQWVGVNEYFFNETDPKSTVVALSDWGGNISFDTSLRVRSGRSMPVGTNVGIYFDREKLIEMKEKVTTGEQLAQAWEQGDIAGSKRALELLGSPDYFVVPARTMHDIKNLGYTQLIKINKFIILKKRS
ncbi:MAG: hypothetical protein GF384_02575 [Elusimicrobia bacterium]|nr:hypothetical protein [Elusimicrobiota bacterium]